MINQVIWAWSILPIVKALERCIVVHYSSRNDAQVKYLMRGTLDLKS